MRNPVSTQRHVASARSTQRDIASKRFWTGGDVVSNRRWLPAGLTIALTLAVLAGCSDANDAPRALPSTPPSGLFMVDGRSTSLDCQGQGGPVVVLDAGLGNPSSVFGSVLSGVASTAMVCRWDRPGLG
jgi:hypothetical protein